MKVSSKQVLRLIIVIDLLLICILIFIVSWWRAVYTKSPIAVPSTPTLDTRPRIQGCISWALLEVSDYIENMCVYGYPSGSSRNYFIDTGVYFEVEFYTNPDWHNLDFYDWRDEGRPYILRVFLNETRSLTNDEEWYMYRSEYADLLLDDKTKCVSITGKLLPVNAIRGNKTYKGFLIEVKSPSSVNVLDTCY